MRGKVKWIEIGLNRREGGIYLAVVIENGTENGYAKAVMSGADALECLCDAEKLGTTRTSAMIRKPNKNMMFIFEGDQVSDIANKQKYKQITGWELYERTRNS